MEVGTIENPESESDSSKTSRGLNRSAAGSSSSQPPNDDGGDDGSDPREKRPEKKPDQRAIPPNYGSKSKIFTWFLLLVVLMTFGGLLGAYVVLATNNALEWNPFDLPYQVWISTVLIILASATFEIGRSKYSGRDHVSSRNLLIATTVLGATFISSQILAWLALIERGYYMSSNPYAGFFYILTAAHAVHVVGGIIALGYVLLSTWNAPLSDEDFEKKSADFTATGWYWHAMGVLWIAILLLLTFWK